MTPLHQRVDLRTCRSETSLRLPNEYTFTRLPYMRAALANHRPYSVLEEIRQYQLYLTKEKKLSASSILVAGAAIRFLYKVTLERNGE